MNLNGAVAVVTGAGRGIGKAVATTLAANGAKVMLTARSSPELEEVKEEIERRGGSASVCAADLTVDTDVERLFEWLQSSSMQLDVLVNNAGIATFAPVRELAADDFTRMWNLNMRAVHLCTQHALRMMEPRKIGAIVNIASLAGRNAFIGGAGYAATKWALIGYARSLMLEVREQNIRVITICPGSVDTTFSTSKKDPARSEKILHPQDVAETVLAAITLPDRAMVSEIDIRPTNPR